MNYCIATSTPDHSQPLQTGALTITPLPVQDTAGNTYYAVSCGTATATPESIQLSTNQTQTNLFYGFLLFLVFAFSIIAFFQKRLK